MRIMAVVVVACVSLLVTVSCTPEQQAAWLAWWNARPSSCRAAVEKYWPAGSKAWAHSKVQSESGGLASAQNRSSSAAGCFQLLRIHAWRFAATGSSWASRYDAAANTLAALHLFREQGKRPWCASGC